MMNSFDVLEAVLDENDRRSDLMRKRIAEIRRLRAEGKAWSEIVTGERRPLVVELLSESSHALDTAGSQVRRTQARELYEEGLTMEHIAELFGVSRQRVSALLKDHSRA